jgi:hypothetical protein
MTELVVDRDFVNTLYNNLQVLSEKHPDLFDFSESAISYSNSKNGKEFSVYGGKLGFVKIMSFYSKPHDDYDDSTLDSRVFNFISFFNRTGYLERMADILKLSSAELVWLMSWSEFLFWNHQQYDNENTIDYSRDPYDYLWLTEKDAKPSRKLELLTMGAYKKEDALILEQIPEYYIEPLMGAPRLESVVYNFRFRSISLRV